MTAVLLLALRQPQPAARHREGILLGSDDGPFHNVVKIRPPMPFSAGDADHLLETFERLLRSGWELRR
jgi:4-aminobutyrate aminotransferase-like enzyme